MSFRPDASTVDLTRTRIRLKSNVTVRPQLYRGETYYHIECLADSKFYRIGHKEYVFLSLLDGRTTFSEALALTARSEGANAFLQEQALQLYSWLLENEIAVFADEATRGHSPTKDKNTLQKLLPKMNPFWIRIPFGQPDAVLKGLQGVFGWLFSPAATVLAIGYLLAAVVHLVTHWNQFAAASTSVFSPDNWLWLLIAWLVLKILHETAHGLTCQRYGGEVRETGIILAFFAPLAYVDVTSSWAFSSRWKRIHTAAAGMYVELLLAATAVFLWTSVRSELATHFLYNVIVMASVSTLLFNANPLMKFDGYYILSDLLEIPNLQQRASEATQQLVQRLLFGLQESQPQVAGAQLNILRTYGVAAFGWRLFICASMTIAASVLFHGAGIVLSIAGVLAWFAVPVWKTGERWLQISRTNPARSFRAAVVSAVAIIGLMSMFLMPVPFHMTAPGVVSLNDGCIIRVKADGFVESIHVADGQTVEAGDLLVTLRNSEITTTYDDLKLQIRQESIRRQTAMRDHDAGLMTIAEGNLESLQTRLADAQEQLNSLQIFAARSGRVLTRALEQRKGTYVHEGDELLIVDSQQPRELHVLVDQEDFNATSQRVGETTRVRLGTRSVMDGRLARVIPQASHRLPEESLSATNGGPLAVRPDNDERNDDALRMTEPRFQAVVELPSDRVDLPIGERGYASIARREESIGVFLYRSARDWLSDQLEAASAG